jgi:hypothetical protein
MLVTAPEELGKWSTRSPSQKVARTILIIFTPLASVATDIKLLNLHGPLDVPTGVGEHLSLKLKKSKSGGLMRPPEELSVDS